MNYSIDDFYNYTLPQIGQICKDNKIKKYTFLTLNQIITSLNEPKIRKKKEKIPKKIFFDNYNLNFIPIDKIKEPIPNDKGIFKTIDCKICNGSGFSANFDYCQYCRCTKCELQKYYCVCLI